MFMIITDNNTFGTPNAAFCRAVRDQAGLTMPVLYDPTGQFQAAIGARFPNDLVVVVREGMELVLNRQRNANSGFEAAEAVLNE
ncbi:MAG: hypothetical protein ACI9MR_001284 [Myxococcota bacterium]|jgi:hypothetical protein